MHANQQSARAMNRFYLGLFVNKIALKSINLVAYQVPATKIEIAHTKINTLYACIRNNVLKPFLELQIYIVIDSCHWFYMAVGSKRQKINKKKREPLTLLIPLLEADQSPM